MALRDIDRFERQKVKDLKEIFTNFAIMQIKQCKKVGMSKSWIYTTPMH